MKPVYKPLSFYVDKLKNNEPFSLVRFGDGELYCLWGRQGKNSNGCDYTPKLRDDLQKVVDSPKDGVIYGLQHVLPGDQKRAEQYNINWYDSEVFGDALAESKLYPLIAQLRLMKTVVVGNDSLAPISRVFYYNKFVTVPPSNAYKEKARVYQEIGTLKESYGDGVVFIFCCGMAGTVFPYELHDSKNWYLDLGHIFDPFVGNLSRFNLEHMTKEDIERNLHA